MASASLIKDQAHPKELLALYVQVDGVLTDAYEVKYEVFDESASLPGTSLISKTVTTTGKFATGCYGAYDTTDWWKPTSAYARCRIEWKYKIASTETEYRVVVRTFEVLATSVASQAARAHVLVQDVKDAGSVGTTTDRRIRETILEWRDVTERYCRQRFGTNRETKRLKGTGGKVLFLMEPFAGISSFRPNSESTDRDLDQFIFWGHFGEDRRNPRIEWGNFITDSIYYPVASGFFGPGLIDTLAGVFGFVEPDTLEAPWQVQRAVARGVLLLLQEDASGGRQGVPGGVLASEETDGHRVGYAVSSGKSRGGMLSILESPAIRDTLDLYRAPIVVSTTTIDASW